MSFVPAPGDVKPSSMVFRFAADGSPLPYPESDFPVPDAPGAPDMPTAEDFDQALWDFFGGVAHDLRNAGKRDGREDGAPPAAPARRMALESAPGGLPAAPPAAAGPETGALAPDLSGGSGPMPGPSHSHFVRRAGRAGLASRWLTPAAFGWALCAALSGAGIVLLLGLAVWRMAHRAF